MCVVRVKDNQLCVSARTSVSRGDEKGARCAGGN